MTGNNTWALEVLQRMSKNRPPSDQPYTWADSLAYLIADREGKKETCNQILRFYREYPDPPENVQAIAAMLTLFDESGDKKAVDSKMIQALVDKHTGFHYGTWLSELALFVGYFEWTHGRKDNAIEQWKKPARLAGGDSRMLACKWLRDAGVDPIHIEDREFPDVFLRERYELPKKKE